MAKIKLTKSAVDAAQPQAQPVELRDTLVPGFLCKITPTGRKVWVSPISTDTFIKLVKIEGNVRDGANGITQEVQPGVQI